MSSFDQLAFIFTESVGATKWSILLKTAFKPFEPREWRCGHLVFPFLRLVSLSTGLAEQVHSFLHRFHVGSDDLAYWSALPGTAWPIVDLSACFAW